MTIEVHLDERVRLLAAALLHTGYCKGERKDRTYDVHPLADELHQATHHLSDHPCVRTLAGVIGDMPYLFVVPHLLRRTWPGLEVREEVVEPWEPLPALESDAFTADLRAFRDAVAETGFWKRNADVVTALENQVAEYLGETKLDKFLDIFWAEPGQRRVFVPNVLCPRNDAVGPAAPDANYAIIPPPHDTPEPFYRPRQARWYACHEFSHPPYAEAEVQVPKIIERADRIAIFALPFNDFLPEAPGSWRFVEAFIRAVQVLYMRHFEKPAVLATFIDHEQERYGLKILDRWADLLEPYWEGRLSGTYENFAAYFPRFLDELEKRLI